jgi:SPX domain protein involved in polyphosphate accumulation
MGQGKLQKQRHELKYVIPEHLALAVRDFVRCYLDLDLNGADQPDLSYPVHSLYMDSPGMALYNSTINGDKNRFKLRIRFYNEREDTPVFLEIKRRMNNIISKKTRWSPTILHASDIGRTNSGCIVPLPPRKSC